MKDVTFRKSENQGKIQGEKSIFCIRFTALVLTLQWGLVDNFFLFNSKIITSFHFIRDFFPIAMTQWNKTLTLRVILHVFSDFKHFLQWFTLTRISTIHVQFQAVLLKIYLQAWKDPNVSKIKHFLQTELCTEIMCLNKNPEIFSIFICTVDHMDQY